MRKLCVATLILVTIAVLGAAGTGEYNLHAPIRILGDEHFTEENGVCKGSGTEEDPYIIESLEIDAAGQEFGVQVESTAAYFILRDSKIYGADQGKGWQKGSGIQLRSVRNGQIENCAVFGNREQGISSYNSRNIVISANQIIDNGKGIYLENSSNSQIWDNIVQRNVRYGIYLMRSFGNSVASNVSENNGLYGIRVYFASNNRVNDNIVRGNDRGIVLDNAFENIITNNEIQKNNSEGIDLLWQSNSNTICANRIHNNVEVGIDIPEGSCDNLIYHNELIGNGRNAIDKGANRWDNGVEGNFWDDYAGMDVDGNGIGDAPYMILGGANQDRYPLIEPRTSQ
jgi:parallel beta-helix repeat protein